VAPACARCSHPPPAIIGQGLGDSVALIPMGVQWPQLWAGGRPRGPPEAGVGGAIALIQDGDTITVDTKPAAAPAQRGPRRAGAAATPSGAPPRPRYRTAWVGQVAPARWPAAAWGR